MRHTTNNFRQIGGLVILMIAWMTWFHATVSDPMFLCVEAASDIRLEVVSSGCCASDVSLTALPEAELDGDDCHGCEDLALHFLATSHRPGLEQYTAGMAVSIVSPPTIHTTMHGTGTACAFMQRAVPGDKPPHVLIGAVPLIC